MEILNPAWKRQQKRRLAIGLTGVLSLQAFTVHNTDYNPLGALVGQAFSKESGLPEEQELKVEMNEIGHAMQADISPYSRVSPGEAVNKVEASGNYGILVGDQISVEDAMRHFYIAGFRGEDLKIITAMTGKESAYHPGAIGDWNYAGDGGRSVGLTQIHCIDRGNTLPCVGARNWEDNFDPQTNANNAYVLYTQAWEWYGYGSGALGIDGRFQPWKSSPEAALEYLPQSEAVYNRLQDQYGNLG